jgi:RNA polymerase primary sigma factor
MTGERDCPPKYLNQIADVLKVDRGWLLGKHSEPLTRERQGMASASQAKELGLDQYMEKGLWCFRKTVDQGRDYGNPNVWATPADIATLVRETGQNTTDASAGRGDVHMRFSLIRLNKGKPEYARFLEALRFDDLKRHIDTAARTKSRLATKLRAGLSRLEEEKSLYLMRIDDYGSTGLYGDEFTSDDEGTDPNPFAALVRNNLDSSKATATAGGSFGLGKAVLWRCSEISSVVIASDVEKAADSGTRLVGKAELTWHRLGEDRCAGPGWLGKAEHGESLWVGDEVLRALQIDRHRKPDGVDQLRAFGTSLLIVAFRDPDSEEGIEPTVVLDKIAKAAATNFWYLMVLNRLKVTVEYIVDGQLQGNPTLVDPEQYVPQLCEALRKHDNSEVVGQAVEPGDVVRVSIPLTAPATKPGIDDVRPFPEVSESRCTLLVRLARDNELNSAQLNKVALVRGRGMVTQYLARDNIVVGARPFHAVLLAGEAAGTGPSQIAAEQFLRLAEPPAHNKWKYNEDLGEKYRRPVRKRLEELDKGITDALRDVIKPAVTLEEEGPEELQRLLQLVEPDDEVPAATLRKVKARVVNGEWEIDGEIHVNDRQRGWLVTPRLWIDVESGSAIRVPLRRTVVPDGSALVEDGVIAIEPKTTRVSFQATSVAEADGVIAAKCRAKIDLHIDPRNGGSPNA